MPLCLPTGRRAASALLFFALLLCVPSNLRAGEDDACPKGCMACPCSPCPAAAALENRVYRVDDLVSPPQGSSQDDWYRLIELIRSTVAPESWNDKAGGGMIVYEPITQKLLISQTPAVHEKVQETLDALRRLHDVQVSLEVRFVSADESFVQRVGLERKDGEEIKSVAPADPPLRVTFLNDQEVFKLLEAAQDDRRTNVMQAPKLTLFNGQESAINAAEKKQFVTGVKVSVDGEGNLQFLPQTEEIPVGLHMAACPAVSADHRFVKVHLNVNLTGLDDREADLIPVVVGVPARGEGGDPVKAAAFTQFLQKPRLSRLAMDSTVTIPDGGAALISGWKRDREVRTKIATPVLSDIPYINRLFTNVGYGREKECVLLLVTPRIVVPREEEEKVRDRE